MSCVETVQLKCFKYPYFFIHPLHLEDRLGNPNIDFPIGAVFADCDFLGSEGCDKIIKNNFSNYSAWHFRGIIMPKIHNQTPGLMYAIPVKQIKEDLEMLKHGYFTDPKDQSPWNYHDWLISLVSPIQVVAMRYIEEVEGQPDKVGIVVGLSHKVRNFADLAIDVVDEEGNAMELST